MSGKPDVILSDRGFQCNITNKKQLEKAAGCGVLPEASLV